jgi:transposase
MRPFGSPTELEHRRKLIVHRVLDDGYSIKDISKVFDVHPSSIRRWLRDFEKNGDAGLCIHPASGRPPKLTYFQEKIVTRWILEKPTTFGFNTDLWTTSRLAQVIEREFGIHFNSDYLVDWLRDRHLTPQKPQKIPRKRDPEAISEWLKYDWPRIKKKAARKKAYLALIDETGLFMTPLLKRTWAPRGHPPSLDIKMGGQNEKVSVAGAICLTPNRGRLGLFYKALVNDYFDKFFMAAFLEAMLRSYKKPIVAVWDGGRNHSGDPINELMDEYSNKLFLEPLPPYAPVINPVESVWSWLKYGKLANFSPKDVWDLERKVEQHLRPAYSDQDWLTSMWRQSELPLPRRLEH